MSPPTRTLRSRIVWSTAAVAAVAMAAMIGIVMLVLNVTAKHNLDATLHDRYSAVSATLITSADGSLTELDTPDDSIDDSTWIFDRDGRQIDGPRAGKRVQAKAQSLANVTKRTRSASLDRAFLAAPVLNDATGAVAAVIVVSESAAPYQATRTDVLALLATLGLLVTAGSAAIAAWTMGRALDPVEEMATLAEDWSEHDLESRFEDDRSDHEIAHLGHTLNLLLDRVAGVIRAEQQLTSELAHELRTPLTAIRGEAELALIGSDDSGTDERLSRVVNLVDRMDSTISTLLAIARGHAFGTARSDVAAIVTSVLADLPEAHPLTVSSDIKPGAVHTAVPTTLAARALAPVINNAVQHACSQVSVAVKEQDRTVDIIVSDDGPGIGSLPLEDLFTAGIRDAEGHGAGLGLALSRRVARTFGGEVRVTSAADPTSFTLTLPRF